MISRAVGKQNKMTWRSRKMIRPLILYPLWISTYLLTEDQSWSVFCGTIHWANHISRRRVAGYRAVSSLTTNRAVGHIPLEFSHNGKRFPLTWMIATAGCMYRVAQKIDTILLISSNINRFSKLFHCQNQEKICNNTITKDPTTPQVCHCTTLWMSSVCRVAAFHWSRHWSVALPAWVRRPAARQTHWTFDVKTAGCDSYFRQ